MAIKNLTSPRWMVRKDLDTVLKIERSSYLEPKGEEYFADVLSKQKVYALVLGGEQPYGYAIYRVRKSSLEILDFAVDFSNRRQGGGTKLMEAIDFHCLGLLRTKILIKVPDSNLGTHCFLKKLGFIALKIVKEYDGDSYLFVKSTRRQRT
jgi:[ribosomal protein S18]-alanine N-acetyltransferase